MAAGFITKGNSTRWVEFADATVAPVQGNIQLDPTTGLPIDTAASTLVKQQDSLPVGGSVTSAATLFTQDMDGYDSISLQVTSAGTACRITYETSDDNSTWLPAPDLANTSVAAGMYEFARSGRYFRARVSTYGSGTVTVVGHLRSVQASAENRRRAKWYSGSVSGLVAVASAGDVFAITGNANTKTYVTKIGISGVHASGNLITVIARKRSTANTGGTSAAVTAIPHDAADPAAQATVLSYTANPTGGTIVGSLRVAKLAVPPATAVVQSDLVFNFGETGKPVLLGAATDVLAINLNNATTAATLEIWIEWFEI